MARASARRPPVGAVAAVVPAPPKPAALVPPLALWSLALGQRRVLADLAPPHPTCGRSAPARGSHPCSSPTSWPLPRWWRPRLPSGAPPAPATAPRRRRRRMLLAGGGPPPAAAGRSLPSEDPGLHGGASTP